MARNQISRGLVSKLLRHLSSTMGLCVFFGANLIYLNCHILLMQKALRCFSCQIANWAGYNSLDCNNNVYSIRWAAYVSEIPPKIAMCHEWHNAITTFSYCDQTSPRCNHIVITNVPYGDHVKEKLFCVKAGSMMQVRHRAADAKCFSS